MSFKITWKTHIVCFAMGLMIMAVHRGLASRISRCLYVSHMNLTSPIMIFMYQYAILLLLMVPITVMHEFIHGSTYKLFGGRVRYGFKGIYAYTQEVSEKQLSLVKFIVVLISPVVLISCICLIIPWDIMRVVYLLNLLGSSGDIYMTLYLLRFNRKCKIVDRSYGFDILDEGIS